jgi:hypothetical protein
MDRGKSELRDGMRVDWDVPIAMPAPAFASTAAAPAARPDRPLYRLLPIIPPKGDAP